MSAFSLLRSSIRTSTITTSSSSSIRARAQARAFSSSPRSAFARIIITGRLAAEPELQATSTGQDVVRYTVGTSYGPRDNRQTSWFRISSFQPEGPFREFLLGLSKGTLVCLEGDASMRTREDAEGKKITHLNITQRNLEVLSRPHPAHQEGSPEGTSEGTQ
ncbi:hypothetical protein Egran_00089 [Elaphomyces granulatus]|uniref:SsDNA binding protein n=1 Tax=Elaphomyces granulatus TaxID=519963 RepID=A0A232M6Z9_9EURO|nr:hypothetical protein Egran_00089 [Elaphomyces granulatus]